MNEWWTYRVDDFLMFSPRVYARLFEQVNEDWWPLQLVLLGAGLLGLVSWVRGRHRWVSGAGLGAAWLFCTAVFVDPLYRPINWAVGYLVPVLLTLALLLPVLAWRADQPEDDADDRAARPPRGRFARPVAGALGVWALLVHPLLAPVAGRGWRQAELIALAPDPTAIATLALLLALPRLPARRWRIAAAVAWGLVLAWCLFSGFLLAAMASTQALILGAAATLAVLARHWPARPARPARLTRPDPAARHTPPPHA